MSAELLPEVESIAGYIGERVKQYRSDRGVSAASIARAVGKSPSWVSNVEAGKSVTDVASLIGLCRVLQVNPEHLLPPVVAGVEPMVPVSALQAMIVRFGGAA